MALASSNKGIWVDGIGDPIVGGLDRLEATVEEILDSDKAELLLVSFSSGGLLVVYCPGSESIGSHRIALTALLYRYGSRRQGELSCKVNPLSLLTSVLFSNGTDPLPPPGSLYEKTLELY